MLSGDAYTEEVRADERAATELGINGVPFFVLDRRYGVSGAHSPTFSFKHSSRRGPIPTRAWCSRPSAPEPTTQPALNDTCAM